jgi:hypothetical protein
VESITGKTKTGKRTQLDYCNNYNQCCKLIIYEVSTVDFRSFGKLTDAEN